MSNAIHVADDGDTSSKLREWSSLIGIVTAIVGNILISFALNIQRYAHIRLDREQDEKNEQWSDGRAKTKNRNYGTQQSEIAEERAQLNLHALPEDERNSKSQYGNGNGNNGITAERESLHSRSSSDSTIKQSEKLEPQADRKTYLKSPYWWAGLILMIVGEAGNFIAYGFAPASIVSPLGVVALVSNCIIAPVLLKERFRQRDFWGVAIAIAGAVTIVLSAKNSETKMGPHDVWAAITRWEFETYLGITTALIIILMWASGKYGERTILIDLGLVALFGGYTALSTKGVASLLSDTLWRALTFPITYLLVFILVVTALLQIRYVNRALQRFDSTQVIPVQFVLFTISVIIGSAVLYRDFQSANADRFGKFFGGCALTFLGVYLITSGRARGSDDQDAEDKQDEEEAIGLVDEERYQDEVEGNEEDRARRQSSISFTFTEGPIIQGSRRSSRQQPDHRDTPPRTPPPLLSHTSTASSRFTDRREDMASPLLENPWQSDDSLARPQAHGKTISSPLLPSEAQRSNPSTPNRPSTLSRRSMARLTPGPLMSPLSSSLSAVVADSLRKGMDSPSAKRSPRLSGTRISKSQRGMRSSSGGEAMTGSSPLKAAQLPEEAVETERPAKASRSQSVGATLGEFFRLKRERGKGKSGERGDDDTQQ
ncbi:hypothetical protein OEA41_009523 [Lepraria neglecta]|uniref:DUF803-domain-containing protein n=1 Tax=Lepraria neglecta TaxID=209136 RepID=A0AAD9Z513_9LECA|nr:hypothetical protein OEA41_009523 [Lepraria neglecta]